jgi:hypothetical protein
MMRSKERRMDDSERFLRAGCDRRSNGAAVGLTIHPTHSKHNTKAELHSRAVALFGWTITTTTAWGRNSRIGFPTSPILWGAVKSRMRAEIFPALNLHTNLGHLSRNYERPQTRLTTSRLDRWPSSMENHGQRQIHCCHHDKSPGSRNSMSPLTPHS